MSTICPITLNPNLRTKPGLNESLGFGRLFTDHMFVMDYQTAAGWFNPRIEPYAPISIAPSSMVLHYSQTIFEGLKAYKRADGGINLFRPLLNFERLNISADRLAIPPIDTVFVLECLKELLRLEADWIPDQPGASLYIRPFIFATDEFLGVRASNSYKMMIILSPSGAYYEGGLKPVSIYIEDHYVRAVRGGIGAAKTGGNYAASIKSQKEANAINYDQVLWLDGVERRYIEEVGAMNVFFLEQGTLITPELNGSILPGITRRSVMELALARGYKVIEKKIAIDDLLAKVKSGVVSEGFGSGTAAVIAPIGRILYDGDTLLFGDGGAGPLALEIYEELTAIQFGRKEDPFNWVVSLS